METVAVREEVSACSPTVDGKTVIARSYVFDRGVLYRGVALSFAYETAQSDIRTVTSRGVLKEIEVGSTVALVGRTPCKRNAYVAEYCTARSRASKYAA